MKARAQVVPAARLCLFSALIFQLSGITKAKESDVAPRPLALKNFRCASDLKGIAVNLSWFLVFISLFLSAVIFPNRAAGQTASISEVGIQGFYAINENPTRVRVDLTNPQAQPVTLELTISIAQKDKASRVDRFSASVPLRAGENRSVDLPVSLMFNQPVLTLDARTSDGRVVAHQVKTPERPEVNALVLILCAEEKICNDVHGTILSSGNDEQKTRKTRSYTFLILKQLPEEWWVYQPARSVILARPASGLTAAQRAALEGYCRQRGQVAVIEPMAGPGFLDSYRSGAATGERTVVGSGLLFRFENTSQLADFIDRSVLEYPTVNSARIFLEFSRNRSFGINNTGSQLATVFQFPTLRWLMVWLIVYVIVVGVLNFYVLTRMRRRELAWVTVPAIALLFALMLFFFSASKRPRSPGVDEVATYVMDDNSPTAAADYDLRAFSPYRDEFRLAVPGEAVWSGSDNLLRPLATFSVFDRMPQYEDGWMVRLAPRREFSIPLLQWSYQDLGFSGIKDLPGTIHPLAGGEMKNDTGITFRRALFRDKDFVYDLGTVSAGASFNPRSGRAEEEEPLMKRLRLEGFPFFPRHGVDMNSADDVNKFLLSQGRGNVPTFVGLAEAPVLGAALEGVNFTHRQYVVVIVSMRETP